MADLLLNNVINNQINVILLSEWILNENNEDKFKEILAHNVTPAEFITFFLNFLHDEASSDSQEETPQKPNSPKQIDKFQTYDNRQHVKLSKSNLFSDSQSVENSDSTEKYCTPKKSKIPSKNDHFSPISPLYQTNNSFTLKNSKNTDRTSLCLGDFIVNSPKNSKKKKPSTELNSEKKGASRRIKPTILGPNSSFINAENSFNFSESLEQTSVEQRNVLVQEKMKVLSKKDSNSAPVVTKRHNSLTKSDVYPVLKLVSYKSQLDCVVQIYKSLLNNCLVLNVTSEIYFLISLLLSVKKSGKNRTSESSLPQANSDVFESIHNVVYFAAKSLESQIHTIKFYDKVTINLLADNEILKQFAPRLSQNLQSISEKKSEMTCAKASHPTVSIVCFNLDTDNKENFPHQTCFHAFRKQRDLFYDILKIWETEHLGNEWNFALRFGGKIRTLFSLNEDPSNFAHMARLFKNQLLSTCAKGPKERGLPEGSLFFLPSLSIDSDKLDRLTNRLVTKQPSSGINAIPTFTGHQEFYKEFIVTAINLHFNKHLSDCLASEIVELSNTNFTGLELEEDENEVSPETKRAYLDCLKSLRVLAKFLGFIETLPYKSEYCPLSKHVVESQLKVRSQSAPPLDVKWLLRRAIEQNCVVLLIPWLTKYLAMLDYCALRLPYYVSVHRDLFKLYRSSAQLEGHAQALVRFCLGWLFELPHFPESQFFEYYSKTLEVTAAPKTKSIDTSGVVDQRALYLCCPYLEEIKRVLPQNASANGRTAVKYITPVTAIDKGGGREMTRRKIEQQLEDAFLNGQPASVRKTVEFVSERIASATVKLVCQESVPKSKEDALNEIRQFVINDDTELTLKQRVLDVSRSYLEKCLRSCEEQKQQIAAQKIAVAVDSLLPQDVLSQTRDTCARIATKMYNERVEQWLRSHVTLTVFTKNMDSEVRKLMIGKKLPDKEKSAFALPPSGRSETTHCENTFPGYRILHDIKETCCDLTDQPNTVNKERVLNLLHETHRTLTKRHDVNDALANLICVTLFDLCLLLVAYTSILPSDVVLNGFHRVWGIYENYNSPFKTLLCPRNVAILQNSKNPAKAWNIYAEVVCFFISKNYVDEDDFESQCTGFYNRDWDQVTLENYSAFLKAFLKYSSCDVADSKFAFLLDFLSDFCSDL